MTILQRLVEAARGASKEMVRVSCEYMNADARGWHELFVLDASIGAAEAELRHREECKHPRHLAVPNEDGSLTPAGYCPDCGKRLGGEKNG